MRTDANANSHKSVFLIELCSAAALAYKGTVVLHTVNRDSRGKTFEHRYNTHNGVSNYYSTYTASEGQQTGYFEFQGMRYYQYSITLVFKVQL